MKINNLGPMGINPYKRQLEKSESAIQKSNSKTTDKVEISSEAKGLQESLQLENKRQEKVEQLKMQVQSGTYKIDHQAVAKGMYDFYVNLKKN